MRVPEFDDLAALTADGGWAGPTIEETATDAWRFGWRAAVAAVLEVEHRQQHPQQAPRNPKALRRTIAPCYAGRCPDPSAHTGPCGPVARRLHTARRADDLDYRRRVIAARRQHPPTPPLSLPAMPAEPSPPDQRVALLRQVTEAMADGTMSRDTALAIVEAAGLGPLVRTAQRGGSTG